MVTINSNSKCDEAKPYYYDYLSNLKNNIPTNIGLHIDECSLCQDEINKLNRVIEQGINSTQLGNSVIVTGLKLHFAYENTTVTCQTVKPFLPSLADPLLKIRIPTPITVHIDNCEKCRGNLKIIRSLNLSHKQLCTLGQIFAEPQPRKELCMKVQEFIPHVVALSLSKTPSEILKHLCICPDCRLQLYQRRDLVCKGLLKTNIRKQNFPCESIQPTAIFDYCFPYCIEVENNQYAKSHIASTSHISVCATCLNKMQQLHGAISEILECTNSGIVTCYRIISNQKTCISNTKSIYKDWPIEVKVFDSSQQDPIEISTVHKTKVLKRTYVRNFVKISSAAAVILLLFILYFNIPVAKATGLNQIYNAISRLQNVYFATYTPNNDKPIREEWISASLNTVLLKTNSRIVLWDIDKKIQKSIDLQATNSQIIQSDYENWEGIQDTVLAPWGLLPFNDIDNAPEDSDADWRKIDDKIASVTIENTEIYELTWKEQTFKGSFVLNKWRGYIDVNTKLLKRCEFWQKFDPDAEYDLKIVKIIECPSVAVIEQQIKNAGF